VVAEKDRFARLTVPLTGNPIVAYETYDQEFESRWTLAGEGVTTTPSDEEPWDSSVPAGLEADVPWVGIARTAIDVQTRQTFHVWLPATITRHDWLYSTGVAGLLVAETMPGIAVVDTLNERFWRVVEPQRWASTIVGSRWLAWKGRRLWVKDFQGQLLYRSEPLTGQAAEATMVLAPGGLLIVGQPKMWFIAVE
jgi:hypothetical protein